VEHTRTNFQVGLRAGLLLMVGTLCFDNAEAQVNGEDLAINLRSNVVRVIARGPDNAGFGFIVGERDGFVYIVTADHVVRWDQDASSIGINFFQDRGKEYRGDLLTTHLPQSEGDVAVIRSKPPPGFSWKREVRASVAPVRRNDVWFVGLNGDWYVPARSGLLGVWSRMARFGLKD
jgi:hypothetical protein